MTEAYKKIFVNPAATTEELVDRLNEERIEVWYNSDGTTMRFNPSPLNLMRVRNPDGIVDEYIVGNLKCDSEKYYPFRKRTEPMQPEQTVFSRLKSRLPRIRK